jgi:hypothetical protein
MYLWCMKDGGSERTVCCASLHNAMPPSLKKLMPGGSALHISKHLDHTEYFH